MEKYEDYILHKKHQYGTRVIIHLRGFTFDESFPKLAACRYLTRICFWTLPEARDYIRSLPIIEE